MGKLYLLKSNGLYKIGVTCQSIKKRISDLQTGNPYVIDLVFLKKCSNYFEMEVFFHDKFAGRRLVGEWFALDYKDVEYIKNCRKYSLFKKPKKKECA